MVYRREGLGNDDDDDDYDEYEPRHRKPDLRDPRDPRVTRERRKKEVEARDARYYQEDPVGVVATEQASSIDSGEAQFADLQRQLQALPLEHHHDDVLERPLKPRLEYSEKPPRRHSKDYDSVSDYSSRDSRGSSSSNAKSSSARRSSNPSSLRKGYHEARHLAGGIIHHPAQYTPHYSILRHSHGLVFYQGVNTYVAISVFADAPLPEGRTYWLKAKNWSTTAKSKATFRQQSDDLLNVTPATVVKADQLDPNEERAWQRDIAEFERRTHRGRYSTHILRETLVIRIPASSGDGYFQIVLSAGDTAEAVCISPSFRILSVSPHMGGISGAHWSTLPFEVGAMALSWQAKSALVAAAVVPIKSMAKSKTRPSIQSHAAQAQKATKLAYGATGAADKVGQQIEAFDNRYNQARAEPFSQASKIDDDYTHGPKTPYPIRFAAHVSHPHAAEWHIVPALHLDHVAESVMHRLCGYYFGWVCIPAGEPDVGRHHHRHSHWYRAVMAISPVEVHKLERVTMSLASRKDIRVQILADDGCQPIAGAEIRVEVFGCLRPWDHELESMLAEDMRAGEEVAFETALVNEGSDLEATQAILEHPAWDPDEVWETEQEIKAEEETTKPDANLSGVERLKHIYATKRLKVQQKIDKVPAHMLGVRMPVDRMKDQTVVTNGFYIRR